MQLLLNEIQKCGISSRSKRERERFLDDLQRGLAGLATSLLSAARLSVPFEPQLSTETFLESLLSEGKLEGKHAALAQHLVGAKLELRFPNIAVPNNRLAAADASSGREGDFEIGDTVIHVTVAPGSAIIEKCKRNLQRGRRVYLLVPESLTSWARVTADMAARGRIAVQSIESFVATNIEELSEFTASGIRSGLRRLLETYNRRVSEVEADLSLLIDLPSNLT